MRVTLAPLSLALRYEIGRESTTIVDEKPRRLCLAGFLLRVVYSEVLFALRSYNMFSLGIRQDRLQNLDVRSHFPVMLLTRWETNP
jgi:hypothetical protein